MAVRIKNTNQVYESGLPNSQLEFMEQVGNEHGVKVEPKACKPSRERILSKSG
jgi:hypothetical protein